VAGDHVRNGLAVTNGDVFGAIAESKPGGKGSAKAVRTITMIQDVVFHNFTTVIFGELFRPIGFGYPSRERHGDFGDHRGGGFARREPCPLAIVRLALFEVGALTVRCDTWRPITPKLSGRWSHFWGVQ